MIVIFVSECEKTATKRTRQILDSFAERIGSKTWKTRITMEGLKAIKVLLSKYATRQTSVACHRIAGRYSTELMWVVGNKAKFNSRGICPTNYSEADQINDFENSWFLLPHIKTLTALASLFHDFGKSSECFQSKLKAKTIQKDPLRHEWISCVLLKHFIKDAKTDEEWLRRLKNEGFCLKLDNESLIEAIERPLHDLPPFASMLMWLILSHHRMPVLYEERLKSFRKESLSDYKKLFKQLNSTFGYKNDSEKIREKSCLKFPKGFPTNGEAWNKQRKRWSAKALEITEEFKEIAKNGLYRIVLHFSRLCLMLGDHYYSSRKADKNRKNKSELYANTGFVDGERQLKQMLDEHLVGVMENAVRIAHQLPDFETEMPGAASVRHLRKRSPQEFTWQNKAVEEIESWRNSIKDISKTGFFALNMASTGCGKTIANAKIMRATSIDKSSLRYIIALGLRTLTLQTGEVYRNEIGLDDSELAVLIGSKEIKDLFERDQGVSNNVFFNKDNSSESSEDILSEFLDFECGVSDEKLVTVLQNEKHRQLLYAPLLVCTIDHLMSATESIRGGHHILPCLRLMSSDLVIDEIDDFTGNDLIAISRLIHLAGMLGRKIMLSSATIPPDLALGFFNAYQNGYKLYAASRNFSPVVGCAWIDEFKTKVSDLSLDDGEADNSAYVSLHAKFTQSRCRKILASAVQRRGFIAEIKHSNDSGLSVEEQYFEAVKNNIFRLHTDNCEKDKKTGRLLSLGVVRMANIKPCVSLGRYLMNADWGEDTEVKIMVYHSQQIMILRHVQEKVLDKVLKRKRPEDIFKDPFIRRHLNRSKKPNLIYIVVATPVEEIGRDHDFNWALIEPSSFRSVIQMAGRVRRHRKSAYENKNIAVMQFNFKGFKNKVLGKDVEKVFCRPGFENEVFFTTHDLKDILDEKLLENGINSIPRIVRADELKPTESFVDLEHHVTKQTLAEFKARGPEKPMGWISQCWWLSGLPQMLTKFRAGMKAETLYLIPENSDDEDTTFVFMQKNDDGDLSPVDKLFKITHLPEDELNKDRIWLDRDYYKILVDYSGDGFVSNAARKFGSIEVTTYDDFAEYEYSSVFGLVKK
ncbi:MAG: CRISPR-associated endonuclease/helicase Cas3 [Clostridiales bacterium]|jgi:CRISPR-associated endonuclease/helicase Cas3|nr:CRISPR-associated endonuclease/helicase Cas3 [Clostridiales bacterium]MDN5282790.1 CRISPR-associated endonuclease/helicase Cas3 [Candidatus Ozemobacter sp.]